MTYDEEPGGRRASDEIIVILKQQVTDLLAMVSEIKTLLGGDGSSGRPGVLIRLDRLEQLETARNSHRTIIYTAIIGLIVERIWHYVSLLGK